MARTTNARPAKKKRSNPLFAAAICLAAASFILLAFAGLFVFRAQFMQPIRYSFAAEPLRDTQKPAPPPTAEPTPQALQAAAPVETFEEEPIELDSGVVLLRAVGDLMAHDNQLLGAKTEEGYSFHESFASIADYLRASDIAAGNLELTIAEKDFSGFPSFRTPVSYLDALSYAGFDVLTFANNHTLDGKVEGVIRTIDGVLERGMLTTGAFRTKEESAEITYADVNGVRIVFLAYADMAFRAENWRVNTFDDKKLRSDFEKAKALNPDLICVMAHWGTEYSHTPNSRQLAHARTLASYGADIILGAHPHVLQSWEWIVAEDENGVERKSFVAYSMGNFLSNQKPSDANGRAVTEGGAIFNFLIQKDMITGKITIEASAIPTFVLRRSVAGGKYAYDVLPVEAALAVPESESDLTSSERRRMGQVLANARDRLGDLIVSPNDENAALYYPDLSPSADDLLIGVQQQSDEDGVDGNEGEVDQPTG